MLVKLFVTFVLLSAHGCTARVIQRNGPRSCADPRAPRCPYGCVMEDDVPMCKPESEKCGRNEHSANGKCYCDIGTEWRRMANGGECVDVVIGNGRECPPGYKLQKDGRCFDINDIICRPELNEFPTGTTDGCDCKLGYVRNAKNVCVPASDDDPCPKVRCTGECVVENGRPICKPAPTPKYKCGPKGYMLNNGTCVCSKGYKSRNGGPCVEIDIDNYKWIVCKPNQVGGGLEKCACKTGFVRNIKDPLGDCIAANESGSPASDNPCSNVRCPGECMVEKGRPVCKSVATTEGPKRNCTRCGPKVTTPAPPAANDPCDLMRCEEGTTCHIQNGQGVCLKPSALSNPCAKTDCPSGHECIVERVQCVRAPCPPIATCKKLEKRR